MERIGLDIDDVLTDFWGSAVPIFNKKYGILAKKSDFKTYTTVLDIYSISIAEFEKTIIDEGIFEIMKPYDEVPYIVQSFKELGS